MKATFATPTLSEQIIVFADLRGYHRHICSKLGPGQIFDFLSEYYSAVQSSLDGCDGQVIKFIGDAILLLFPATDPRDTIDTLEKLKTEIDLFLSRGGYHSQLCIKAHVGTVAIGRMGEGSLERLDVCGLAVNQTALLPGEEWSLSRELQKKMEPR